MQFLELGTDTFFKILKIGDYFEVLFKLAVDLREEVDFNRIEAFAQLIKLVIDDFLTPSLFVLELGIKVFKIRQIQHVVFLEVDAFNFLITSQQLSLHIDCFSLRIEDTCCSNFFELA